MTRNEEDFSRCRAWREIDLDALTLNAAALQAALAPGCRLMAVLKADAYGHGALLAAQRLYREGVRDFAVACLEEGIQLRRQGLEGHILILGYTSPLLAEELARRDLTQAIVDEAHGRALADQQVPVKVHLALDTGMHRLGIPADDRQAIARVYALPFLKIRGVFSHLCVCDGQGADDKAFTRLQLVRFYAALAWMEKEDFPTGETHIQASYGILNLPPQPCTLARAGIALYGVRSQKDDTLREMELRPVLSLRARVASVRWLEEGEGAGYGLAYRPRSKRKIAAITIGYGDGLPRQLAQKGGEVLIGGRRCPMVGRMCMDQLLADVTDLPDVKAGDTVTILGQDGMETIAAEEAAEKCGTITNELLARLGPRLPLIPVET